MKLIVTPIELLRVKRYCIYQGIDYTIETP